MKAITTLLAGGAAAFLAGAAPAEAQFFPGQGYGYANPYSGYGAGANSQMVVNQCASAAQARLGGGYGYGSYSYGGGRVLGISRVEPRGDGGMIVRGVASSGRYAGYGYGQQRPDLTWRCRADFRGFITEVTIRPAQPAYGGGYDYSNSYTNSYTPWGNYDYSQYGYQRY